MATEIPAFIYRQYFLKPAYPTADLSGKTFIVTGANIGLGKEAARHYARLGADKVILACRSTKKGEAAKRDIESSTNRTGAVDVWALDLENYDSVKAFAKRAESLPRIDGVVENAGVATGSFRLVGGNESSITVNVVGTFLLALLLLPKLREVGRKYSFTPTLSLVASEVHAWCSLKETEGASSIFDALSDEKRADMPSRYPVSKLLEILALREMVREHPVSKTKVTINILNPGLCHSGLAREMEGQWGMYLMKLFLARTTEMGSRTLVHAGLQGEETHGQYLSDCKVVPVGGVAAGKDAAEVQKRVWNELLQKLEQIQPGVSKMLDA